MIAEYNNFIIIISSIIFGYILGSIPFGLVLTRIFGLGDIRKIGSGNIGATNVLRTGRLDLAILTIILDSSKAGFSAYLIMNVIDLSGTVFNVDINVFAGLLAGIFGVIGHNFPVWLKFKGGKGVASTLGFLVAVSWQASLAFVLIWLAMAVIFRYSSLSALTALLIVPFVGYYYSGLPVSVAIAFLSVLSIIRHKKNIVNLINKEESKISFKKKKG